MCGGGRCGGDPGADAADAARRGRRGPLPYPRPRCGGRSDPRRPAAALSPEVAVKHSLVVRLDSMGDMLICGPAIRAVAAGTDRVTVLCGPQGAAAARLLPGVDDVLVWHSPWIANPPPAVVPTEIDAVVDRLRSARVDEALILTSFHQS